MISFNAVIVRALLRAYTYPYRKKFASLSRSFKLKDKPYIPPKGFTFTTETFGGVKVEKLLPPEAYGGIILQFHGGGHTAAMNDMYRRAAERLAKDCNCAVYSIDYRTGDDLVYPSVHNECFAAYAKLCDTLLPGNKFFAIGDSFGANLLLSSCLRARDAALPLPSAIVCICPFIDMAASGNSYKENCYKDPLYAMPRRYSFEKHEDKIRRISPYCRNTPLREPYLSPAYANFYSFPKTLIQCGALETSLSDGKMLYDRLSQSGCTAELHIFGGMWHDFMYMFPRLKESKAAWQEVVKFLNSFIT